jgi:C4-dicarboxylate transporter, DctQ subunit
MGSGQLPGKLARLPLLLLAAARIESVLGAALIAAVALNVVNVVSRYAFGDSITGADEIETYLMVAMAFVGSAVASVRHAHLRMDVLTRSFRPGIRAALERFEALLTVCVCGLVTYVATIYALRIHALDSHSENAHIAMWIPHSLVAIGFGLMTLVALVRLFGRSAWLGPRTTHDHPEAP